MKSPLFALVRWSVVCALLAAAGAALRAQSTLPDGKVGTAYSFTIVTTPAAPSGTVYGAANLPTGLSINGSSGTISGTPTTPGTSTGTLSLTESGVTNNFAYQLTIDPAAGAPAITSATTASGTAGSAFSYTATASNSPTSFNIIGLPAGLSANATTGVISGLPAAAGTSTVSLSANNSVGTGAISNLTVTVGAAANTPVVTSAAAATGTLGTTYTTASPLYQIVGSNNPTSFSAVGLPLGLSVDPLTGLITGTPGVNGVSTVTLSAANAAGTGPTTTLTVTIGALSAITSGSTASATQNQAFTFQLTASNSPSSFNVAGLPNGLTSNSAGLISGTPTTAGTYTVTVSANNPTGTGPSSALALTVGGASSGGGGLNPVNAPPSIVTQPASQTVAQNSSVTFTVAATGSGVLTYQWYFGSAAISGATGASYTIASAQPANQGTYTVIVSNGLTTTSSGAILTVSSGGSSGGTTQSGPVIVTQPASQTVTQNSSVTFTVGATGTGTLTFQWYFGSAAIAGATGASYTINSAQPANQGTYTVIVSNGSAVTSTGAVLTVTTPTVTTVTITTQPAAQTVNAGGSVTLSVSASGPGALTYQWQKNGAAISGATNATVTLTNLSATDMATYTVVVTSGSVSVTSAGALVTVVAPATRLVNVSMSALAGVNGQPLLVGLTVGGTGTKSALIRAVGPTLAAFGIPSPLPDPTLTVVTNAGVQVATDTGWGGTAALSAAFVQTGAFSLPVASKDSAILANLSTGLYSAQVTSASKSSGLVLLEAYDADTSATPTARFLNLSALAQAGSGSNVMTIGFYISGTSAKTLLVRGIGPTLAQFGVAGVLTSTRLSLFDSHQNLLSTNSGWGGTAALTAAFAQVQAFSLPANSLDSALLVTLQPGLYTVQLSSATSASGTALIELYDVQ